MPSLALACRLSAVSRASRRPFSPASLFSSGEQGVWYDPSDLSTLFQDDAGTIPVTAVEQPVGLMLDKSKGLVLGPELVTNGGFDTDSGWTKGAGWVISGGQATFAATGANSALTTFAIATAVSGRTYEIQFDIVSNTLNGGAFRIGGFSGASFYSSFVQLATNLTPAGTYKFRAVCAPSGAGSVLDFWITSAATSGSIVIDNISVRELPGNHAYQSTTTSRPTLSARYNLLTKTEQFDNAAWGKTNASIDAVKVTAPNGTLTAQKLAEDTANSTHQTYYSKAMPVVQNTFSVYAKAAGRSKILFGGNWEFNNVLIDLETGEVSGGGASSVTVTAKTDGWWLIARTGTPSDAAERAYVIRLHDGSNETYTGDGTSGIYIWGADLRLTNAGVNLPPYQRVDTATDYDYAGFPPYLKFDGTDDSMATGSIDFTGTDKMTVFAGVRKLSDAAVGIVAEFSPDVGANNGSFYLLYPRSVTINEPAFTSKGTIPVLAGNEATSFAAPISSVLGGIGNISGDSVILRVNGTKAAQSTADQGTGNYGNYQLYIGRRGGTTLPFNGRLYSLVVCGKLASAAEITATEAYINQKTRAY